MVSPYFNLTSTTVCANQQRFWSDIHSAASLSLFCERFTEGDASVRLSRSRANRVFVPASALHSPESCASDRAMMCSMSVCVSDSKLSQVYGL